MLLTMPDLSRHSNSAARRAFLTQLPASCIMEEKWLLSFYVSIKVYSPALNVVPWRR